MRLVGYVRVSSEEQSRDGVSLDMQERQIRNHCEAKHTKLVALLADEGVSAKDIEHRPGFIRCLEILDAGEADGLIVWRQDRAFRSALDALSVKALLEKRKQVLVSLTDPVTSKGALGRFHYGLNALLGQLERDVVSERTRAALAEKRERGEKTGGLVPYGFKLADDGIHLQIEPEEAKVIDLMKELHEEGLTYRAIARRLNEAGYTTKTGKAWHHVQVSRVVAAVA